MEDADRAEDDEEEIGGLPCLLGLGGETAGGGADGPGAPGADIGGCLVWVPRQSG
jgi:hypothetical protein